MIPTVRKSVACHKKLDKCTKQTQPQEQKKQHARRIRHAGGHSEKHAQRWITRALPNQKNNFAPLPKQASKQASLQLASVPELVNRTISTEGTASMTILARVFSWREGAPKEVPFSRVSCTIQAARAHARIAGNGVGKNSLKHVGQKQFVNMICVQEQTGVRKLWVFLASSARHYSTLRIENIAPDRTVFSFKKKKNGHGNLGRVLRNA